MNRLSITTRAVALAFALLISSLLPAPSAAPQHDRAHPPAGDVPAVAALLTVAAACLAVDLAIDAIKGPWSAGEPRAAPPRRLGHRPLMPFYSFASSSSARTQES